jgi:hypothetical protein
MEELQLKYLEIVFNKQAPQNAGIEINISSKIDSKIGNLEYKFIVGKGGIWNTIQEFSKKNECVWKPKTEGEYMVMVQARDKYGKKPLDYLAKEDYSINSDDVVNTISKEVSNPKEVFIGKTINKDNENIDFKDTVDNVVFLEAKEISMDEKKILLDSNNISEIESVNEIDNSDKTIIEKNHISLTAESENIIENKLNIIKDIIIDKEEILIGEKCSIEVKPKDETRYLYRFYIKRYKDWDIVRDYDTNSILKYTATEAGEKEFLIQCKRMESVESFEEYRTIKVNVKNIFKAEITNFKCLSKSLIVGEKLEFSVATNVKGINHENDKIILLYKFYKIYKDGKSICIQDYSTKNDVYYRETEEGSYRILCLVKSMLSNKEYDDRAILVYDVKPYKDVIINSFVADLNSPQVTETDIKFTSNVQGGNSLLYRYKVKGPIEMDTTFISTNEFTWKPMEAGEYEIMLYVKDINYKGEYEDTKKIAFSIEKKGTEPVKISNIIVDNEKKLITGEPVDIMVNAEGGTRLQYAFTIRKDNRKLKGVEYNKSNWVNFIPMQAGEYEVEIMIKDKYSNKPYDTNAFIYLKAMEYIPGEIDYIILPYKDTYLVGDAIEFECIIQNTQSVLVKYETKINGQSVEQTAFSKNKKLRFMPKITGKYTIEFYAKNVKCMSEYDSKKQINLNISEAPPVIQTKIITNRLDGCVNQEFTFEAISRGGKDVCYEFYLMENNEWKKVQEYSRKYNYSFIPFAPGKYKILALAKSYYKKVNYEDYDEMVFHVKDITK